MNTNGKVVEVILGDRDDNDFFDYFAEKVKQSLPYGSGLISQNNRQKSIVIKGNEFWVCQYFYNPYNAGLFEDVGEINIYANGYNGVLKMHVVTQDDEIPDTDIYRVGSPFLWVALADFLAIPTTAYKRERLASLISENSDGCFFYSEQYHDIRSYRLGRSATIQEIALLLSFELAR